jgi:hypothetical protein
MPSLSCFMLAAGPEIRPPTQEGASEKESIDARLIAAIR